jgi:DNA-binding CsgD family transcriptional regulator
MTAPAPAIGHPTQAVGQDRYPANDGGAMEDEGRGMRLVLAGVLAAIVVGGIVDLVLDAPERWMSGHVLYELGLILGGSAAAIWLWRNWKRAAESARALERSLGERQAERDAWRERAAQSLQGLGRAVSDQFRVWGLTPAEREVALQLLKGQSHKEIAAATGRSERTVRQHAVAVYHKAGVGGRAELAAFFLGDLSLPPAPPVD